MNDHPIALLMDKADKAINEEDFDTVIDLYTEDAVLVIKPGKHAVGKLQIWSAMEAIAVHFVRSLDVRQDGMVPSTWLQLGRCRRGAPVNFVSLGRTKRVSRCET